MKIAFSRVKTKVGRQARCVSLDANVVCIDVNGDDIDVSGDDIDVNGEESDVNGDAIDVNGDAIDVNGNHIERGDACIERGGISIEPKMKSITPPPRTSGLSGWGNQGGEKVDVTLSVSRVAKRWMSPYRFPTRADDILRRINGDICNASRAPRVPASKFGPAPPAAPPRPPPGAPFPSRRGEPRKITSHPRPRGRRRNAS